MLGVAKALRRLAGGALAPNAQLRSLNPHVGAAVGVSGGCALPTQLSASPGGVGGVSSFGYSGTIAHAVARRAAAAAAHRATPAARRCAFRRRAFGWREPTHRSHSAPSSAGGCDDSIAGVRSPTAGALHALVADHIVRGRVVFFPAPRTSRWPERRLRGPRASPVPRCATSLRAAARAR